MTGDRSGIGHVIDAIDNALAWTEPWADAMTVRYGDNGDGAPEDVAASPGHHPAGLSVNVHWFDEPHGGPAEPVRVDGWEEIGWFTSDAPAAFRRDDDPGDETTEEVRSWGGSVPIRVISTRLMPDGLMMIGRLAEGTDLTPYFSSAAFVSAGFNTEAMAQGFARAGEAARDLRDACQQAADFVSREYGPIFDELARSFRARRAVERMVEDEIMDRLIWGLSDRRPMLQGIVASSDAPQDPRERALQARRNRNTGPARNPHRHRGI